MQFIFLPEHRIEKRARGDLSAAAIQFQERELFLHVDRKAGNTSFFRTAEKLHAAVAALHIAALRQYIIRNLLRKFRNEVSPQCGEMKFALRQMKYLTFGQI